MIFKTSEAHEMLKKVAREFAEKEVGPLAADIDLTGRFPRETFEKMAKAGFTGIGTPIENGGSGADDLAKVIVVSEIARKCAATAATLSIHTIFPSVIMKYGSKEQKEKYLPLCADGGKLSAFCINRA